MTRLRVLRSRLCALFGRSRRDDELSEEIEAHLELLTEQHARRGLSLDEARLAARRDFGGVDLVKERYRDQRGWPALEAIWLDLRHALRIFRRSPGFAATAVVSLAVGIAAATGLLGFKGSSQRVCVSSSLSDFEVPPPALSSQVPFAAGC